MTQRGRRQEEASPKGEKPQGTGRPGWGTHTEKSSSNGQMLFVPNLESHLEPSERVEHLTGQVRPLAVDGALLSPGLPRRPLQQPPN